MKRIVILNGHPRAGSLCDAVCDVYRTTLEELGAKTRTVTIRDLAFDPWRDPMRREDEEPALGEVREAISSSQHLTVVFPTWWTGVPALTKAFLDRTFISGWAFRYRNGFPEGLLGGRGARIIQTMGAPWFYNRFFQGRPQERMLHHGTLGFCGFRPVRVTTIDRVMDHLPAPKRAFANVRAAARRDARMG